MKQVHVAVVLLTAVSAALAQEPIKLQCDGSYSNYVDRTPDVPVHGVHVEIQENRIRVFNALAFSGNYVITNRLEQGIGFVHEADRNYQGFVNRFSGQLSLSEKQAETKYRQVLTAACSRAKPPLF